jgi:hypothetical protein
MAPKRDPQQRGGERQRRAQRADDAPEGAPQRSSALATFLINMWCWGWLSPQVVQQIAMHAQTDIQRVRAEKKDLSDLKILAGLGTEGRYPNNINSELRTKLKKIQISEPLRVKLPLLLPVGNKVTQHQWQSILLPHVLFADIFHNYPTAWCKRMVPSLERLHDFWAAMDGTPLLEGHAVLTHPCNAAPARRRGTFRDWAVPLSLHCDGVPVTGVGKSWSKSLDVTSWCSLLARGSTIQFNFWIWSVFAGLISQGAYNTKNRFWKVAVWSFHALYTGFWPYDDWDNIPFTSGFHFEMRGKPLAGGFFGVLWAVKVDLEALWKEFKLAKYDRAQPCSKCPCDTATMTPNDFRPSAEWMKHIYTKAQWATSVWRQHEIFKLPGVTIFTFFPDLMHCKHMGCDAYFLGSVLWMLCYEVLNGGTPTERCAYIEGIVKNYYAANKTPTQFTNLTVSMFTTEAEPNARMPKLKGRAAEVRYLNHPMLEIWRMHMDRTNMQHVQVEVGLQSSCEMEDILNAFADEIRLPSPEDDRFKTACFNYLLCSNALGHYYSQVSVPRKMLFDVVPKHHQLAHCGLCALHLNPRLCWCYSGEDFMNTCKRVTSACVRGNKGALATEKFCEMYRMGLHLQFNESQIEH